MMSNFGYWASKEKTLKNLAYNIQTYYKFLHDFMLNIYNTLTVLFCTRLTEHVEYVTNVSNVKNVHNE